MGHGGRRLGAGPKPGGKTYKDGEIAKRHGAAMDKLSAKFLSDPKTQYGAWKELLPYIYRKQPQGQEMTFPQGIKIIRDDIA